MFLFFAFMYLSITWISKNNWAESFRKLVLEYHPDVIPQLGEKARKILVGEDFFKNHDSSCTRLAERNRKQGNKSKKEMHLRQSRSIVSE